MVEVDHGGHRQRLKERFINEGGMDSFTDHQVLELLLFYGIPYKDTNGYAHMLIDKYGSLSGVLNADYRDLAETPWIGLHAAVLLSMTPSLTRRYAQDRWKDKIRLSDVKNAGAYAATLFVGDEYEAFYMICMDSQNRVIKPVLISRGTINEAMIYPRLVVENALRYKAAVVILSHNHPGGSTEPSLADIDITKKLAKALEIISIKVMDHIIVAGDKYLSLADKRIL